MIVLSLNIRGVGDTHKILSLKRLVHFQNPNVILIQERMCVWDKEKGVFSHG
jgi:hypothetical protein